MAVNIVIVTIGCTRLNMSYEDYVDVKDIIETYNRDSDKADSDDLYEEQAIIESYQRTLYSKPIEDYSETELKEEFEMAMNIYNMASTKGYNPNKYDDESYKNIIVGNLNIENENDDQYYEADETYKRNIEKAAEKRNLTFDQFVSKIMIPYIKIGMAKDYLQSYYFKNIYKGSFKDFNDRSKELTNAGDDIALAELVTSEEYQNAYISFLKDFDSYCENLS